MGKHVFYLVHTLHLEAQPNPVYFSFKVATEGYHFYGYHPPHIANMGAPPMLDPKDFPNWQFCMKSHMSSSCVDLLDIIERGFSPRDPHNLTPSEKADHQLNATAMHMIQTAAGPTYLTHLRRCTTVKESWAALHTLFLGNESIQRSK